MIGGAGYDIDPGNRALPQQEAPASGIGVSGATSSHCGTLATVFDASRPSPPRDSDDAHCPPDVTSLFHSSADTVVTDEPWTEPSFVGECLPPDDERILETVEVPISPPLTRPGPKPPDSSSRADSSSSSSPAAPLPTGVSRSSSLGRSPKSLHTPRRPSLAFRSPRGRTCRRRVHFSAPDSEAVVCAKLDLLDKARTRFSQSSPPQKKFPIPRADAAGIFHKRGDFDTPRVDSSGAYRASDLSADALRSNQRRSVEALIDTGATRSVVGLRAARRIFRAAGTKFSLAPSRRRFRFGVDTHDSKGSCVIRIPTPSGVMEVQADVVAADVPFLLGLDTLDRHRIQALTITNKLQHVASESDPSDRSWVVDLVRHDGHIFLPFVPVSAENSIFYTRQQLQKLHRSLYHPSAQKLYDLLKRADPDGLDSDTRRVLQDISRACEACQRFSPAPLSFKISIPGFSKFNSQLRLDLFWLQDAHGSHPVLHVVDTATHLQAASFLSGEDSASVWNAFVRCWSRLYVGDPEEILTDAGTCFTSPFFSKMCDLHDITLRHTNVESHNSLGEGETYHHGVRKVFNKLRHGHPSVERGVLLQLSIFAINSSVNEHGLIPLLLAYGMLPRLPGVRGTGPLTRDERLKALEIARDEYAQLIAQRRIKLGLNSNLPSSIDEQFEIGDLVYLWRETPKCWTGPFKILNLEAKNVWLKVDSKGPKPFSITRVKRALAPLSVNWTEVLKKSDPRYSSPEMLEATRAEMVNLIKRGTFSLVVLPDDHRENVIPTKFVLALKHTTTGEITHKARFVLGGHRDRMKSSMVHTASTMTQTSVRLLLALAAAFNLDVWTEDVQQAFLQSASNLQPRIFIKPDMLQLGHNEFLQLLLPLYGITEAGDYWGETLSDHCLSRAKLAQTPGDLSLFYRRMGRDLCALSGNYVDDLLRAAPSGFRKDMEATLRGQFDC